VFYCNVSGRMVLLFLINLIWFDLPEARVIAMRYIFASDSMGLSSFKSSWWPPKTHAFWNRVHSVSKCVMALQAKSLILAPIKSTYATSYWSSIVTLVVSCPVSEILQLFCWIQHPTPIPPAFWGCSLWTRLLMFDVRLLGSKALS